MSAPVDSREFRPARADLASRPVRPVGSAAWPG